MFILALSAKNSHSGGTNNTQALAKKRLGLQLRAEQAPDTHRYESGFVSATRSFQIERTRFTKGCKEGVHGRLGPPVAVLI